MKKSRIIRGRRQDPYKKIKSIPALIIVFGFIFGMGFMPLYIGYQEVKGAFASSNWPFVYGTITHSEVKITEERVSGSTTTKRNYSYQPEIKYEYYLDGMPLIGERVRFGGVSNRQIAENLVGIYKPGDEVQVYYNPDNPKDSVLEPGISFGMLLMPMLGLAAIGCGILGVIIYFKFFWES